MREKHEPAQKELAAKFTASGIQEMDILLEQRISDFKSAKLPKNLIGYINKAGHSRRDFTDYREWRLYAILYEVLVSARKTEDFSGLAVQLFKYLDRHPTYAGSPRPSLDPPLNRKNKKKRRKDRSRSKGAPDVAYLLKRAKPSTATLVADWKASPVIGLGLESITPPTQRLRREDTKIDEHTAPTQNVLRPHALYTAGWSLKPEDR